MLVWGFQKKKGVKEKGGAAIVVVGTGSGDIIAWDTALGELKWRTSDCHAGYVMLSMCSTVRSNHFVYMIFCLSVLILDSVVVCPMFLCLFSLG